MNLTHIFPAFQGGAVEGEITPDPSNNPSGPGGSRPGTSGHGPGESNPLPSLLEALMYPTLGAQPYGIVASHASMPSFQPLRDEQPAKANKSVEGGEAFCLPSSRLGYVSRSISLDRELECSICLDNATRVSVVGCNHRLCIACAKQLCSLEGKKAPCCPLCRGMIKGFTQHEQYDFGLIPAIKSHMS